MMVKEPRGMIYPRSIVESPGNNRTTFYLVKHNGRKQLAIQGDAGGFTSGQQVGEVHLFPLSAENAHTLRSRLSWLNPVPSGLQTSFGFGDRLGLATAGHIRALRASAVNGEIVPILAQQSVRENNRTGRSPQEVMDDAMWGVFQAGWRGPWAADADHVKRGEDIAAFVQAGYTFYTIDPSDHVDSAAAHDTLDTLRAKATATAWPLRDMASSGVMESLMATYSREAVDLAGLTLAFDEETILRALAKYGRALRHTAELAQEIERQMGDRAFDLEMSVDETSTPTTLHEHAFIANELHRQQIPVNSLALRFPGKFQKGVDYMGDLQAFEADFSGHTQIMRHFGRYKLSIHTGSDKFAIYAIISHHSRGSVHVKTAGTSYLEALRVIAQYEPVLFRQILAHARDCFEEDRHSYFLDGKPENVPAGEKVADDELPTLLDQFDARQMLHVTFGSTLKRFGETIRRLLTDEYEAAYGSGLESHFGRHLRPFMQPLR
jgi:hypothetical protein